MTLTVRTTKTGKPVTHGTVNAYQNHKCRCRECKDAWAVWHREWTHRAGLVRPRAEYDAERRAAMEHGTQGMYTSGGCRCDECRQGSRERRAAARARQRAKPSPAHVHGTTNGYQNWGCRCDDCTAANNEASKRWASTSVQRPPRVTE